MINREMMKELAQDFISARDYYDLLDCMSETSYSELRNIVIEGFKNQNNSAIENDEMYIVYNNQFFYDRKEKRHMKSFDTLNNSIDWLKNQVSLSGWNSKKESFTILMLQTQKPFHCSIALNTEYGPGDEDYNHFVWWDKSASLPDFYRIKIDDKAEEILCFVGDLNGCDEDTYYIIDVTRVHHGFDDFQSMLSYFNNKYSRDFIKNDFKKVPLNYLFKRGII